MRLIKFKVTIQVLVVGVLMRIKLLKIHALIFVAVLAVIGTSCIPNKKVIYLQNQEVGKMANDSLIQTAYSEYRLQTGDILSIEVRSSNPSIVQLFQSPSAGNSANLANGAADVNYLSGFKLNENGDIELPLVGFLKVDGLTLPESKVLIETEIKKYITDAYLIVRLGGIRYTALGEFNSPGRFSILQSKVTIFEAIANAGDLTVLANRKNALLIRQYPDGLRTHAIDLTERSLITSPFYYIQPNDQLYLEPLKERQYGAGVGVTGFQTFLSVISAISSALLIAISIDRL